MAFLFITEALMIAFIALLMFLYRVIRLLTDVSSPVRYTFEQTQWGYQLSIDGPWAEEDTEDVTQLEADELQTLVAQPAMVAAPFGLLQGPNAQVTEGFPEQGENEFPLTWMPPIVTTWDNPNGDAETGLNPDDFWTPERTPSPAPPYSRPPSYISGERIPPRRRPPTPYPGRMIEEAGGIRANVDSQGNVSVLEHDSTEDEERSEDQSISSYDTNLIGQETAHRLRIANEMEVDETLISSDTAKDSDRSSNWSPTETCPALLSQGPSSFECLFQRALEVLDFTPIERQRIADSEIGTELSSLFERRSTHLSGGASEVDANEDEEILLMEDDFPLEPDSLTITTHFDILDEVVEQWHSGGGDDLPPL